MYSPKFSRRYVAKGVEPTDYKMLWIQNVPDFQYILIHTGNTISDTEGCLIVGEKIGVLGGMDAVLSSRNAYKKLYAEVIDDVKMGGQQIEFIT